mmetsp:Transcript_28393/g.13142  ORF Transcript_28393/g.13142 Transcript_28393/m.13142 type:complete len:93 (-) Transcript_28393:139-417(-)
MPSIRRIVRFLEQELAKDIKVFDMSQFAQHPCNTAIMSTGYAPRHLSRIAGNLRRAIYDAHVPSLRYIYLSGRRKDEWQVLVLRDLWIHIFT